MLNIIFWIYIFLDILWLLIFIDVILSWLLVFKINFRPKFISSILDPIYNLVKNNIPTTIWIIDFTPIIVMFWIYFLKWLLLTIFPEVYEMIQLYSNIKI
jgi:uncharacterized protein YggT (Ycf19 family)